MTCFIVTSNQQDSSNQGNDMVEATYDSDQQQQSQTPYSIVPRSEAAMAADEKLAKVRLWLETLA